MKVSAANNSIPSLPIEPKGPSTPAALEPAPAPDLVSLRRVAALLSMLENKPEIRFEVLARGRALAADPSYPPPDIINKLAGLVVSGSR